MAVRTNSGTSSRRKTRPEEGSTRQRRPPRRAPVQRWLANSRSRWLPEQAIGWAKPETWARGTPGSHPQNRTSDLTIPSSVVSPRSKPDRLPRPDQPQCDDERHSGNVRDGLDRSVNQRVLGSSPKGAGTPADVRPRGPAGLALRSGASWTRRSPEVPHGASSSVSSGPSHPSRHGTANVEPRNRRPTRSATRRDDAFSRLAL